MTINVDKEIKRYVLEQLHFDEQNLGINNDTLVVEYLKEVMGMAIGELCLI